MPEQYNIKEKLSRNIRQFLKRIITRKGAFLNTGYKQEVEMQRWKYRLIAVLFLMTPLFSFAQGFPPGGMPVGANMPIQFLTRQKDYLSNLKRKDPKLYAFEKRLMDVQKNIRSTVVGYRKGLMDKQSARKSLIPLLKEEIAIRNNPDYQVEQRLMFMLRKPSERMTLPHKSLGTNH